MRKLHEAFKNVVIGAAAAIVVLAFVAWIILFDPFSKPPPLGRDLPGSVVAATYEFDERIRQRFYVPMPEALLRTALRKEGFEILGSGERLAQATLEAFPCRRQWRVLWDAEDGQVTAISGQYTLICL